MSMLSKEACMRDAESICEISCHFKTNWPPFICKLAWLCTKKQVKCLLIKQNYCCAWISDYTEISQQLSDFVPKISNPDEWHSSSYKPATWLHSPVSDFISNLTDVLDLNADSIHLVDVSCLRLSDGMGYIINRHWNTLEFSTFTAKFF